MHAKTSTVSAASRGVAAIQSDARGAAGGLAGRASVKRATRPDPTRPDPTRPDPTRPDPTRPDPTRLYIGQPQGPGRHRPAPFLSRFRSRLPAPALACALALLLSAGAANAQIKLVSNTGQTDTNWHNRSDRAQAFTTGGATGGYKLTAVDIRFEQASAEDDQFDLANLAVSVHSDSSSAPGASLGTLAKPASLPSSGTAENLRFTASSGGIDLSANTTYWVQWEISATPGYNNDARVYVDTSGAENADSVAGWSIADGMVARSWASTVWIPVTDGALQIAVHGSEMFVGNTGQTAASGSLTVGGSSQWLNALTFTTGSNAAGYTLSEVDVELASGTPSANTRVSIYTTTSGVPNSSLHVLNNPAALTASATNTFTADTGATLAANTTYAVVISLSTGTDTTNLAKTTSNDEDSGAASGWSLADKRHFLQFNPPGSWTEASDAEKPMIALRGLTAATPVVSIAGGAAVTEGGSASFTLTAAPAPAADLTVNLNVSQTGDFVATGDLGSKTVTVGTSGPATYTVDTVDDGTDEANGAVAVTLNAGTGYSVHSTQGAASVTVNDNDEGVIPPPPPPPPVDDPPTEAAPFTLRPEPLQLALWTDKPGYRAGETVRLYLSLDPHDDQGRYRTFVYLERAGGERRWLAPLSARGQLHPEAVDRRGLPVRVALPQLLSAADRELVFEGAAPGPGLWQFVLELRPGEPSEQDQEYLKEELAESLHTRRAWAKFVVAERSVLLNRAGFDREIRSDMTLHADTLYYLGYQLFVHAGATLTIEPGTLLQAHGPHAAIIVEPGGRIVAEGTREAPVVLTCSSFTGYRQPGCWGGLRILGNAPVTRLEGVAPGVLPPERPVYGGTDEGESSGVLRYVCVEFAGASGDPEAVAPAIGLYGAGSGTVLDHIQARASLGDGFSFHGGTAVCEHCVASGSGNAGLSWERGWRGGASHLYVHHGDWGVDGLVGGNDPEGHDLAPRSLPTLSNVTLLHRFPYTRRQRKGVAVRLRTGSGLIARDLLATRFFGGAIEARGRSALLFGEGESSVTSALLYLNGVHQLRGGIQQAVEFISRPPRLRDVRWFANPDPRPKADSQALPEEGEGYIGAFAEEENWLEEWTVFGPESLYDLRERSDDEE